jgi:hypothetical protein
MAKVYSFTHTASKLRNFESPSLAAQLASFSMGKKEPQNSIEARPSLQTAISENPGLRSDGLEVFRYQNGSIRSLFTIVNSMPQRKQYATSQPPHPCG